MTNPNFASHWRDIVAAFLKLGATSYGGPAIMGIMQAELQEKRRWGPGNGSLCFVLPAFVIMLALTLAYAMLGLTPILALAGLRGLAGSS